LIFSVKTQHSEPYTTIGLIIVLYSFILNFLDTSLLWNIFLFAKKTRLPVAILSFISSSIRLSLITIVPRYLTMFASSNWPIPQTRNHAQCTSVQTS
jgi:hypothetical protein